MQAVTEQRMVCDDGLINSMAGSLSVVWNPAVFSLIMPIPAFIMRPAIKNMPKKQPPLITLRKKG
jgi:hypothetical protein